MGRLVDPRRHLQQEILSHEIYRERISSKKEGEPFSDWIKAGKILDLIEESSIEEFYKYIKFITLDYVEYAKELKTTYEREIK